ncbi:MAG TPA: FixH family protein [Ignavibacteriaceae bacterium]|nr:FixH family protein [Ignavibacteriaceae bacterium]
MKKIKWNWGTGILLSIIVFMSILIVLVYVFMSQDVDLVTKDYYSKELRYQKQIDKINNTNLTGKEVGISYLNNTVQLVFPDSVFTRKAAGTVYFYRPSGSKKDFSIPLTVSDRNEQYINTGKLDKGLWKIKVEWGMDGQDYYSEKSIMIN